MRNQGITADFAQWHRHTEVYDMRARQWAPEHGSFLSIDSAPAREVAEEEDATADVIVEGVERSRLSSLRAIRSRRAP